MTAYRLTAMLAETILGWRTSPKRFLKEDRGWMPRWKFQPLRRLEHAVQLLEKANGQHALTRAADGTITAQVSLGSRRATAAGKSEAATVTVALARAIGLEVPDELLVGGNE